MTDSDDRVLIVGAGPAGCISALILARAGIPVTLFEAQAELPTDLRASTFHPPTLDMLHELGLADRLVEQGLIADTYQFRDRRSGEAVTFDMGLLKGLTRYPYRLQCEQFKLTRVAAAALGDPVEFNPLYVHGTVGMGKTHLLSAIALEIRRRAPERKVLFLSAVRFMSSFVEAIKARDTVTFKKLFADIDVLLIDDMQFLQGKAAQQEFCHIFNVLDEAKHQVVIAGDLPPARLEGLDERMRSRLTGGLVAQIGAADFPMRRAILAKRAAQMKVNDPRLEIADAVLDFVARRVQGSGRELEGALNQIVAAQGLEKRPLSVDEAAATIRDLVAESHTRQVMIEDVLRAIIGHFNVPRQELLSARRHKSVVYPRQIGMYLAKTLTTRSLPEIGRKFGGRDHTTVLHAVRKIEKMMSEDPKVRDMVETLRNMLRE